MTPYDYNRILNIDDAERLCHAIVFAAHLKWLQRGRACLTEGELTVLCVETFFGEIQNGGFTQYLGNESGHLAQFGADSLRRVGLPAYAGMLEQLLAHCKTASEESHATEIATVYRLAESGDDDELLGDLERKFFAMYFTDEGEFRRRMVSYIQSNEDQFVSS